MKIRYKKQRLDSNFKQGLYFIVFGVLFTLGFILFNGCNQFFFTSAGTGLIAGGFFTLGNYYYQKKNQYLSIENGILKKHTFLSKKINLADVMLIKKFAGDYILKTDKMEFTIDTELIEGNSLLELNKELEKLDLERKYTVS